MSPMHTLPASMMQALSNLQHVTPELNRWLADALGKGGHPDEVVELLIKSGRTLEQAALLVQLATQGLYLGRSVDDRLVSRSQPGSPSVEHARIHGQTAEGLSVRKVLSMGGMEIIIYDNLIADDEIEYLKAAVADRLERSYVVGRNFSNQVNGVRTSRGAFLDVGCHPLVARLEARIAALTGIPATHGEGLQVLHYGHTEEYQPHFDFFEPASVEEVRMLSGPGNRVGTLIMYLNDPEEGGSTYFPKLDLAVHPRRGSALWFGYMSQDGVLDRRSEHAGLPVIRGEKWIATKWLRERPLVQMPVAQWSAQDIQAAVEGGPARLAEASHSPLEAALPGTP